MRQTLLASRAMDAGDDAAGQETSWRQLGAGLLLFVCAIGLLAAVFWMLPPLSPSEREVLVVPRSLEHVRALAALGSKYTHSHYWTVVAALGCLYVFLQAFSIPGSIGLSVVSGALFGVPRGFALVIVCATVGPAISFGLSHLVGRLIVRRVFPRQMQWFAGQVAQRRRNLFNFLLFLRITPFLPNFFINLASPLLEVPLSYFVVATFFGIMPATFMHVSAGQQLASMTDLGGQFSLLRFALLSLLGCVVLLPTWPPVQRRLDALLNRDQAIDLDALKKAK